MAWRFKKSMQLVPGVRINLSGGGLSWTIGTRGASINIGKRGIYLNTAIPKIGLYARQKLFSGTVPSRPGPARNKITCAFTISINDEGILIFKDELGNFSSKPQIELTKEKYGNKIKNLIQGKCNEINQQIEAFTKFHEHTPPPKAHTFQVDKFDEIRPNRPALKTAGFFCKFFKSCVVKIDQQNRRALEIFKSELKDWNQKKGEFYQLQYQKILFTKKLNSGDIVSAKEYFETVLKNIAWPQTVNVIFDIPSARKLVINIDLPKIEDMPNKIASVPQREYKLSIKSMNSIQVQRLYMQYVHAVGFRVIGEAFATSPTIEQVVLSAYSQRINKAIAQISDEYLYSIRVSRTEWLSINFDNLTQIDVVEALTRFDLRRDMSKTGVFKPIKPY